MVENGKINNIYTLHDNVFTKGINDQGCTIFISMEAAFLSIDTKFDIIIWIA